MLMFWNKIGYIFILIMFHILIIDKKNLYLHLTCINNDHPVSHIEYEMKSLTFTYIIHNI